ncbi:MAG: hypothetical protein OSJ60_13475 [Lachnospiraceae bacterium]|jgi:hypothetical protein|nr:hypothetical protein C819_03638 [Lachnospiraceae bacterium 10-1]MCX4352631.1 hypothetical protein [Lachnospiraceae bacterium]
MSKFKRLFEEKVDERQKMDLLMVEHYGFWLMFWLLLAEMIIQGIILDEGDKILGEGIVFMVVAVFVTVSWAWKGVWSYQSKKVPGIKSYLVYSLWPALIVGALRILSGVKENSGNMEMVLNISAISAAYTFSISFLIFLIGGGFAKMREKKLETEAAEEAEDEEDK